MASDEAQLRAIDEEFKKATTDDQRNDCAQRAAAGGLLQVGVVRLQRVEALDAPHCGKSF